MKLNTPNNIEVLLHYHMSSDTHPRAAATAVKVATDLLLQHGCIEQAPCCRPHAYITTLKGAAWVRALARVPMPREAYVDEKGEML